MPLLATELIDSIYSAVPPDLASRSSVFFPMAAPITGKAISGGGRAVSAAAKLREKASEPTQRVSIKVPSVPLSAAVLSVMLDHITRRFGAVAASESIVRASTASDGLRKSITSRAKRKGSTGSLMAGEMSSRGSSRKTARKASIGGSVRSSEDEDERDSIPLQIQSEKEAVSCLLHLRKTADQLLLASLRRTLDEVSDVVTYGKMSVQEWMNAAPESGTAVATPFMSRQQSSMDTVQDN